MNSVRRIADQVAFLSNGVMHFEGTVMELEASDDRILNNFVKGVDEIENMVAY